MKKMFFKHEGGVKFAVDPKVYPLSTIYSAGYVFLDRAFVYLDKENDKKKDDRISVWLFPKDKKEDLERLGMDFLNELLNYAHYFTSLKANAETLKLLMQRALFSAAPSLVQEAEEKEIQELIKELEEEEKKDAEVKSGKKTKKELCKK